MGWGKGKGWSAGAAWSPPGLDHNDRNAADQPERHESMSQGKGGYGNESARYAFSLLYKERERIKQMEEDQAKKERNAELDAMRQEIKNIKNQGTVEESIKSMMHVDQKDMRTSNDEDNPSLVKTIWKVMQSMTGKKPENKEKEQEKLKAKRRRSSSSSSTSTHKRKKKGKADKKKYNKASSSKKDKAYTHHGVLRPRVCVQPSSRHPDMRCQY
jgi:hypothetical protein